MKRAGLELEPRSLDAHREDARGDVRRVEVMMRQRRLRVVAGRRPMHEHRRTNGRGPDHVALQQHRRVAEDRKSTRLNSSHSQISYAVFCLKKKKKQQKITPTQ